MNEFLLKSVAITIFTVIVVGNASADPLVEKSDNLLIDWSNLTVKYTGSANLKDVEKPESFRDIELKARRAGANTAYSSTKIVLSKKIHEINEERIKEEAVLAADLLVKAATSVETEYFADGTVEVGFEAPLGPSLASFSRKTNAKSLSTGWDQPRNSGIVFEIVGKVSPTGNYRILNSAGGSLFSADDVSNESYSAGLMGRWFVNARDSELKQAVGDDPIVVKMTVGSNGTFIVDEEVWRSLTTANSQHLRQSKIALNIRSR